MVTKKTTKARRGAKKRFFEVEVPLTASKVHLYSTGIEELDGSIVKLDLTRSLRGKSLEFKLRIKVKGEKLVGEAMSLILVGSYVRRMMRKGSDYVEDSFELDCKDSKLRVKPLFVTRKRVSRGVRKALREFARKHLEGYFKARSEEELFSEIMSNKLQKELSLKLKKIYPLALCEIRHFEIVGDVDKGEKEDKKEEKLEKSKEEGEGKVKKDSEGEKEEAEKESKKSEEREEVKKEKKEDSDKKEKKKDKEK